MGETTVERKAKLIEARLGQEIEEAVQDPLEFLRSIRRPFTVLMVMGLIYLIGHMNVWFQTGQLESIVGTRGTWGSRLITA